MKRSYKLIGMLLDRIAANENPPIVDQDIGALVKFHPNEAGSENIEFDEFDAMCTYEHYLSMIHCGLVFRFKSDNPHTAQANDDVVKLTVKGYEMLDEYKKWTS